MSSPLFILHQDLALVLQENKEFVFNNLDQKFVNYSLQAPFNYLQLLFIYLYHQWYRIHHCDTILEYMNSFSIKNVYKHFKFRIFYFKQKILYHMRIENLSDTISFRMLFTEYKEIYKAAVLSSTHCTLHQGICLKRM